MKNKGSSLLYVMVILSALSVFLAGFISFTKNRYEILELNSGYFHNLKKKLIETEKAFSASVYKSGIFSKGNKINLNDKTEYYNSVLTGEDSIKRLIYFKQNIKSTGGFSVLSVKDQNGNIHSVPLKENTLYPDLAIVYEKKILSENLSAVENIKFFRKNNNEVIIETKNFFIEGE